MAARGAWHPIGGGRAVTERFTDWQARLTAFLAAQRGVPFRPGRMDCALFAAAAVQEMTGTDIARGFRGYRTLAEGLRKAQEKGFADHVAVFAAALPEIAPHDAAPGDVAVVPGEGGAAMGIVQGRLVYVMGLRGPALVRRSMIERAFRV